MAAKDSYDVNWESYVFYDPSIPSCLRWAKDIRTGKEGVRLFRQQGSLAGFFNKVTKRWAVCVNYKKYYVHRVIWELHHGKIKPEDVVDHIDGNPENNVIENLRLVTKEINARNLKGRKGTVTGITGVYKEWKPAGDNIEWYYCACVGTGKGRKRKYFCIDRLGEDLALELAIKHRNKMIADLNAQGAGYTDRHGQ